MRKRTVIGLCTALVVALLCVSGCGENKPAEETKQEENNSVESLENGEGTEGEESGEESTEGSEESVEESVEDTNPYSAENMSVFCDDLIAQYEDVIPREQIIALVLGFNRDNMTDEDLEKFFTQYNFSEDIFWENLDTFFLDNAWKRENAARIETGADYEKKGTQFDIELYKSFKNAKKVKFERFFVLQDDEHKKIGYGLNSKYNYLDLYKSEGTLKDYFSILKKHFDKDLEKVIKPLNYEQKTVYLFAESEYYYNFRPESVKNAPIKEAIEVSYNHYKDMVNQVE